MRSTTVLVLALHLTLYVSIGFNIPVLRQCLGFVYLTFIPGFLILRGITKETDLTITLLLSVGLSVAFLMFVGLLLSESHRILGVPKPLSVVPLTIVISSPALASFLLGRRKDVRRSLKRHLPVISELGLKDILWLALLTLIPLLSAFGAFYVNNSLLLLAIIGIAVLFATSLFSNQIIPSKLHNYTVLVIAVGLLLQVSLISKHLMGWDIFAEYYVFKLTETAGFWNPPGVVPYYSATSVLNSVLSTTILPTMYAVVLHLDAELVYKVVYPLIYSLVPLIAYKIYYSQSQERIALLSAFFFISNPMSFGGLEALSLAREMIGHLFFVLSIFCLTNKNISESNRRIFLVIFSAAIVVSHYSLSFIYLFFIILTFLFLHIRGRREAFDLVLVLFIIATTFGWYMYVSTPPLNKLFDVFYRMIQRFWVDMFEPQARLAPVYGSLSPAVPTTIVGTTHKIMMYVTHFFVAIGGVFLVIRPKEFKLNPEFRMMCISSGLMLFICLGVPNVAPTLNFSRFYRVIMLFLSILFALGGICFLRGIRKLSSTFLLKFSKVSFGDLELGLVTLVLIGFFLFRVGFVNYVTNDYPHSYSLDFNRKRTSTNLDIVYDIQSVSVTEQEVSSATWLSRNMNRTFIVHGDSNAYYHILPTYALIGYNQIGDFYRNMTLPHNSYGYLTYLNTQKSLVVPRGGAGYTGPAFNISDISFLEYSCVYSNGQNDVYYSP